MFWRYVYLIAAIVALRRSDRSDDRRDLARQRRPWGRLKRGSKHDQRSAPTPADV